MSMRSSLLGVITMLRSFAAGLIAAYGITYLSIPVVAPSNVESVSETKDVQFTISCEYQSRNLEAAAVYGSILDSSRYRDDREIVIDETTNRGGTLMDEQINAAAVDGAGSDTTASYKANNLSPSSLREPLSDLPRVLIWTEKDGKSITRNKYYDMDLFFKKHPHSRGILSFSNIGFSKDRQQALVYFSYYCGSLCAGGSFMILQKKNGKWGVVRENQLWVS